VVVVVVVVINMKSYVINLDRRSDRLKTFYDNLPKDWPYEQPIVYKAISGKLCNHPVVVESRRRGMGLL